MKYIIGLFVAILSFSFMTFNKPKGRATSKSIAGRGEKTFLQFNSANGAFINYPDGSYDESTAFKRAIKDLTEWNLDTISPTMIPEDRALAYKYYSDIPGVVWIEKLLFCDETEVSNLDWIEYIQLSHSTDRRGNANSTMKALNYNSNEQFYYFPVVNVSYEDAINYCKWRTDLISSNYNKQKGYSKESPEYTIFEFSLPSKEEWIKCAAFATDTINYPHLFTSDKVETRINKNAVSFLNRLGSKITETDLKFFNKEVKSDYPINSKRVKNSYLNLGTPFYVWDYPMNNFGIYNIMGNVSEMTSEKGIAKGGSFRDLFKDCTVNNEFKYTTPTDHIGFRCICKLKWPNK